MNFQKQVLLGYLLALTFAGVGVFLLVHAGRNYYYGTSSKDWPQAEGQVVKSSVRTDDDSDGTTYVAEIEYEYMIDGVRHMSDVVYFGYVGGLFEDTARETADRYPVGQKVFVFYDPSKHGNAVLEPGRSVNVFLGLGMGSVFLTIGLYMIRHLPDAVPAG